MPEWAEKLSWWDKFCYKQYVLLAREHAQFIRDGKWKLSTGEIVSYPQNNFINNEEIAKSYEDSADKLELELLEKAKQCV